MSSIRGTERLARISDHLCSRKTDEQTTLLSPTSAASLKPIDSYGYILENDLLRPEEIEFYNQNGYLVVRNLVGKIHLDRYHARFMQICNGEVRVSGLDVMKDISLRRVKSTEGEKVINKIQNYQCDDVLFQYCCLPAVLKYVECFTGPDIMAVHTMLINKPPDPGTQSSRHPLHQDLHYFPFRPANRIVCSWTAMEKVNRENGCLVVLPGTHTSELLKHRYPEWKGGVNSMYHGIKDFDPNSPMVHLEMEAGDTVFFHPLLIHGSGTNRTNRFRKAISCHYASCHCHYISVKGTVQEEIAEEIIGIAKRKIVNYSSDKLDFTFQDIWKLKQRLVQGVEHTL